MKKIKQIKRIAAVAMAVSVAVGMTACQQKTDSREIPPRQEPSRKCLRKGR